MSTFFWPKVAKKCQKKPKDDFPYKYSLEAIEWSWTMISEIDVAKKCYQIVAKSAKIAQVDQSKKCYNKDLSQIVQG